MAFDWRYYLPKIIIQWSHWARMMGQAAAQLLVCGGFVALFYPFPSILIGLYSIALAVFLFPFTWPMETFKEKGWLVLFQNFLAVGPALILASVPPFFALTTLLGGIVTLLAGIFYTIAAIRKEKQYSKQDIMASRAQL